MNASGQVFIIQRLSVIDAVTVHGRTDILYIYTYIFNRNQQK